MTNCQDKILSIGHFLTTVAILRQILQSVQGVLTGIIVMRLRCLYHGRDNNLEFEDNVLRAIAVAGHVGNDTNGLHVRGSVGQFGDFH